MRLCVIACFCGVVFATSLPSADARVRWATPGEYRLNFSGLQSFVLDAENTPSIEGAFGLHRLRLQPQVEVGAVSVNIELDVLTGQIFGSTSVLGARYWPRREGDPESAFEGWTTVEPREFWIEIGTRYLTLGLGQVADHWGMGLVANDGRRHEADRSSQTRIRRPGESALGDLTDRLVLELRPFAMSPLSRAGDAILAIGFDHVYQDDLSWLLHDLTLRGFGKFTWEAETFVGGLYYLYRYQTNRDGDPSRSGRYGGDYRYERSLIDAYARWDFPLLLTGARFFVEAEVVAGFGSTDLYPMALNHGNSVSMNQIGGAVRAEMAWVCPDIAAGIEVGYASGPGDADDANDSLTLDPDHRVGLILFPDVMRMLSLRAAGQFGTRGDFLPTRGGVRNALYFQPAISWRLGRMQWVATFLTAWSGDPYFEPGPAGWRRTVNPFGYPTARHLGYELDIGVEGAWTDDVNNGLIIGLDGGLFVPGSALEGLTRRKVVGKLLGRISVRW